MLRNLLPVFVFAIPVEAAGAGAVVREEYISDHHCEEGYVPRPGGGEGVWVTHCNDMEGVHRWIVTPSGNEIHTFFGDFGWADYDMDGELISWMEEDAREFSLFKDDSGLWFLHHADIERCVETPWGFGLYYTLRDHIVGGELQFRVEVGGEVESCEGW